MKMQNVNKRQTQTLLNREIKQKISIERHCRQNRKCQQFKKHMKARLQIKTHTEIMKQQH